MGGAGQDLGAVPPGLNIEPPLLMCNKISRLSNLHVVYKKIIMINVR